MTARAYRAAFKSKDVNRCGGSGLCRALMGQSITASCGSYSERARFMVSAHQFRDKLTETQKSLMSLLLLLDGVEPRKLASVAARRKKVSALQARCKAIAGPTAGSAGARGVTQGR